MAITDSQFRMGIAAAGVALVFAMTTVRFCGDPPLPPKPALPTIVVGNGAQLLAQSSASQSMYLDYLARDASAAGVATPSLAAFARPFAYRVDASRHVLEVGQPVITLAGLELRAIRTEGALALAITNTTGGDVAYRVATTPVPPSTSCASVAPIAHNAMVLAKGDAVTRAECTYRSDLAVAVTAVETVDLPPLSAFYLGQVPPAAVGIEPRLARGHVGLTTREPCAPALGQALRTAIENRKISWRDLVDFYARHRCQTYQFPLLYRAITESASQLLPAVGEP